MVEERSMKYRLIAALIALMAFAGQPSAAEVFDPFQSLLEKMRGDVPEYSPPVSTPHNEGTQPQATRAPTLHPHIYPYHGTRGQ